MEFIRKLNKIRLRARNRSKSEKICGSLTLPLTDALARCPDPIPVLIVSYNNGIYLQRMVAQLSAKGLTPIVIDNASTANDTIQILNDLESAGVALIARSRRNIGHMVGFQESIYPLLPPVFAYTDPDLSFSSDLPAQFLHELESIAREYKVFKAGCALTLKDESEMSSASFRFTGGGSIPFSHQYGVAEWERKFWRFPLKHPTYELYAAEIDTTMAVYVKENYSGHFTDGVRVAGLFAAIHLPWFPSLDPISASHRKEYQANNRSSTWLKSEEAE